MVPSFDSQPAVSGVDLGHARRTARIAGRVLAAQMGVSESRVRWIEDSARPATPELVSRFLDALSRAVVEREAQR
jgi:hypothetical protein